MIVLGASDMPCWCGFAPVLVFYFLVGLKGKAHPPTPFPEGRGILDIGGTRGQPLEPRQGIALHPISWVVIGDTPRTPAGLRQCTLLAG